MPRHSLRPFLWVVLSLMTWGGLLLAEVLGITVAFDFETLKRGAEIPRSWQRLFVYSGQIPRVAIAVMIAALVHGGMAWKDELLGFACELKAWRRLVVRFLVHVVLFGVLVVLSGQLCSPDQDPQKELSAVLVTSWLLASIAVGMSWLSIALPLRLWGPFLKRRGNSLLVGLAVGSACWAAGIATARLWKPMASATLRVVLVLIAPFAKGDLVYDPIEKVVGTETFAVHIAPMCSGYEGIGLVWGILGSYLWFFRRDIRFPQGLVLLPVGTILIWLLNAVRIALLIGVGNWLSPDIAMGGFHSQAGWIALNAVTLGLIVLSRKFAWMQREGHPEVQASENPAAPYLVPLMVLVTLMMVGTAFSEGFDRWYFLRPIGAGLALIVFRKSYAGIRIHSPITAILCGVLVLVLWLVLEGESQSSGDQLATWVQALAPLERTLWLLMRVVGSCLVVPVVEELAFRGFLARRIDGGDFEQVDPRQISLVAMVMSSLVFGAMHQRFIAGTLAGLIYAFAYRFRGSLGDAILAHAITNSAIAAIVLLGGYWYLWS